MQQAISGTRIHNPKNHVLATYDPSSNMARVDQVKGQAFRTMGRHISGVMWLLPEEALYLLERGSLDIRWPSDETEDEGLPMSLQGAYAAFIGMEDAASGSLTLERYIVYAGLKRSGYIVTRADSWHGEKHIAHSPDQHEQTSAFALFRSLWKSLLLPSSSRPSPNAALGPLVSPGLYRSYSKLKNTTYVMAANVSASRRCLPSSRHDSIPRSKNSPAILLRRNKSGSFPRSLFCLQAYTNLEEICTGASRLPCCCDKCTRYLRPYFAAAE